MDMTYFANRKKGDGNLAVMYIKYRQNSGVSQDD